MDKSIKLSCVIKMKKIGHSVPATCLVVSASTVLGRAPPAAQQPCATTALAEAVAVILSLCSSSS